LVDKKYLVFLTSNKKLQEMYLIIDR
jgi:hypothetical protein